jgi:hypothetical protein
MSLDLPLMAPVEEAIYLALQGGTSASHPALTLAEVVIATGIGQDEVQRACRRLAECGLILIDGIKLSPHGDRK